MIVILLIISSRNRSHVQWSFVIVLACSIRRQRKINNIAAVCLSCVQWSFRRWCPLDRNAPRLLPRLDLPARPAPPPRLLYNYIQLRLKELHIYIYMYILYTQEVSARIEHASLELCDGGICTPNPPTNIVGFRGFDTSITLIWRGGNLMSMGNFPESLSQATLVGTMLVGRLGGAWLGICFDARGGDAGWSKRYTYVCM